MQKYLSDIPNIPLTGNKKVFFASDFHLGIGGRVSSKDREAQIVRWLDHIKASASALFLLGDLFDFWFEYERVVPKGYVRLLGKLAEWTDSGIPVYFFTGNHDMWIFRYFEEELGIPTYRQPVILKIGDQQFFIGHGDGLGPGDKGYKRIKRLFAHPFAQKLFGWIHPNIGIRMADFWSGKSRGPHKKAPDFKEMGEEWLITYCNKKVREGLEPDYFIFGHRHLPIDHLLENGRSRYINLGDWLYFNSFGEYDGSEMKLDFFENEGGLVAG